MTAQKPIESAQEDSGEFFGRAHRDVELFWKMDSDTRAAALSSHEHGMQPYHRMILLTAAVLGVVIPLISNGAVAHVGYLRLAGLWFGATLILGVVFSAASRWLMAWAVFQMTARTGRYMELIGYMSVGPPMGWEELQPRLEASRHR